MSTTTQTIAPAGTWSLDTTIRASTSRSPTSPERSRRVPRDRGRAHGRRRARLARGHGEGRERGREGRKPLRPPPVARLLRRRAPPGAPLRRRGHPPRRRRQGLRGRRADDQGRHQAGSRERDVSAPIVDAYGNDRIGLDLSTTVDRTDFGVDWQQPLPSGEPALANDVTIIAELQFVKPGDAAASDADPWHLRQPPPRLAQHAVCCVPRRRRQRPDSRSSCTTGSRRFRRTTEDDDVRPRPEASRA